MLALLPARPLALARPWGNELKVFSGRVPSGSNQHVVRSSLPLARRSALKMPEGPYETGDIEGSGRPATPDAGHFFMLYERLQFEAQQALGLSADSRETRIIIHLVRSHLAGRLVTSSSLAAASGLSYGTAIRTIEKMCKDKLILKRPRSRRSSSARTVSDTRMSSLRCSIGGCPRIGPASSGATRTSHTATGMRHEIWISLCSTSRTTRGVHTSPSWSGTGCCTCARKKAAPRSGHGASSRLELDTAI